MKNLEIELKQLVAREREVLHEILGCIKRIDDCSLYLKRGYPSLFDYLTLEIGYSNGAAQRRIDAVRLSQDVPEVIESVKEGKLSLAQIGEAQKGFRRAEVTAEEKREILQKLSMAPAQAAQKIVAQALALPVVAKNQSRPQSDGSVRLNITISEHAASDLEKVKEMMSHSIPNGDAGEIFAKLLGFYLAKQPKSTSTAEVRPRQKTVPRAVRRAIFNRDKCCQFKSPEGRICGSRHLLQIDHRQMLYYGGDHSPENLRLLCAAHNRYAAEQTMKGEAAP